MAERSGLPPHLEGIRPDPSTLPHPALFSDPEPGQQARGYSRAADLERSGPRLHIKSALTAVLVMILGTVLCALAVVFWAWPYAVAGVAVGLVGIGLGFRAGLLEEFAEGSSPLSGGKP